MYKNNKNTKLTPVFITNDDEKKHNVNNWTILKIREKCVAVIESLKMKIKTKCLLCYFNFKKKMLKKNRDDSHLS